MALIVQKFGGTSVGTIDRMREVAAHVLKCKAQGNDVVVVVSAMSGETNRLVGLTQQLQPAPWAQDATARDYDTVIASGEQISVGLVSMALNATGKVRARPFLGHQIGMRTDSVFSKARILEIDATCILKEVQEGVVPVIAGFQGVDDGNNITTLGRGGSDTSAVALAAALKADVCEIYTDVDGVYTTDPRICAAAKRIPEISYEEMMELASLGAKVLQIRSVELAAKHGVPLHVRSSFNWNAEGTRVVHTRQMKSGGDLESFVVAGVASDPHQVTVSLSGMALSCAEVFEALTEASVVVDVIVMAAGQQQLSFTVAKADQSIVEKVLKTLKSRWAKLDWSITTDLAKVSIVGVGMQHHPGVAAKMFRLLAQSEIDLRLVSTSEIKISCIISQSKMNEAVQCLHRGFGLE